MGYARNEVYRQIMPAPPGLVAASVLTDGTVYTAPVVAFALVESWRPSQRTEGRATFDPAHDDDFDTDVVALVLDGDSACLRDPGHDQNFMGLYWPQELTDKTRAQLLAGYRRTARIRHE